MYGTAALQSFIDKNWLIFLSTMEFLCYLQRATQSVLKQLQNTLITKLKEFKLELGLTMESVVKFLEIK